MLTIYKKEISGFFASLIGYVVIGVFILFMGLIMWVFPDFSLLDNYYASLDQLFFIAPVIFLFLIPSITMRSFSEELQNGTLEILLTKPISEFEIVLGKYLACLSLAGIAILPSVLYFYSVYQLGSPVGNVDTGAILGSYIGLFLLGGTFTAIGLFSSSLFKNQIVAFLCAIFLCYFFYYGFFYMSKLPIFFGRVDDVVQKFGVDYHYNSISRGVLDSRDLIYFLSVIFFFVWLTVFSIQQRRF